MAYIDSEFENYIEHVYTDGVIPEQKKQLLQAYVAGIWTLFNDIKVKHHLGGEFMDRVEAECRAFRDKIVRGET